MDLQPNLGKNLTIEVSGKKYARYPIRTHLITPSDKDLAEIVKKYAYNYLKKGDIVFIGEKVVSIIQGRAYPIDAVKPSKLAQFLVRFVSKTPVGIGLGSPQTMQLAIEEVGVLRILVASFFAALTKPFGIKGMFYIIAGNKARGIDGAVEYAIPPYNSYVSKIPKEPQKTAQMISEKISYPVAIVDVCDRGSRVLGASRGVNKRLVARCLRDNPLCQSSEQTPIGIIRELD
ncbi:MAG: coenzyme F420-0:L-glutamate ligase [Candidatus Pacebacteria bacterium]|nr:coenzyme F420-0:L-glutamate ligase [Candidatus Paceibacterota bacterium]